jgi:hypothetical protein
MLKTIPKLLWPVVPVVLALLVLLSRPADEGGPSGALTHALDPRVNPDARLLVVVVDSLRRATLDAHMPHLRALALSAAARAVDVQTCSANFTLPCIQTLLEGRQSPFAAGLHNFTGRSGGAINFPAMLAAAGLAPDLISDHTLGSLYGASSKSQFDIQSLPPDDLPRDLAAISRAQTLLHDGSRVVILHVVGTDKVAHYEKPGHPDYISHFVAVDAALSGLLADLDPARDFAIITGDHGHNEDGHHTRDSVALFWGHGFLNLWSQIDLSTVETNGPNATPKLEQTDLLFFLSHPFLLPLPLGYEGRFWSAPPNKTPQDHFAAQADIQRRALRAAGVELNATADDLLRGSDIAAAFDHLRDQELARRSDSIWQNFPLFWLYALFCALGLRWISSQKSLGEPHRPRSPVDRRTLRRCAAAWVVGRLDWLDTARVGACGDLVSQKIRRAPRALFCPGARSMRRIYRPLCRRMVGVFSLHGRVQISNCDVLFDARGARRAVWLARVASQGQRVGGRWLSCWPDGVTERLFIITSSAPRCGGGFLIGGMLSLLIGAKYWLPQLKSYRVVSASLWACSPYALR